MGGGGPTKKQEEQAATGTVQNRQFQPFMPMQQEALAQQLSAGFGAPVAENMGLLNQMYSPVSMPVIQGAADINALRGLLDSQGILAPGGKSTTETRDKKAS